MVNAYSLADPDMNAPLTVASTWVTNVMLGDLAVALAIIAIAGVGVAMLCGRIELRRGVTVLVGCFLLFGSSAIADALRSFTVPPAMYAEAGRPLQSSAILPPPSAAQYFDPYAGASVPSH